MNPTVQCTQKPNTYCRVPLRNYTSRIPRVMNTQEQELTQILITRIARGNKAGAH
jgi:hypothetical protein